MTFSFAICFSRWFSFSSIITRSASWSFFALASSSAFSRSADFSRSAASFAAAAFSTSAAAAAASSADLCSSSVAPPPPQPRRRAVARRLPPPPPRAPRLPAAASSARRAASFAAASRRRASPPPSPPSSPPPPPPPLALRLRLRHLATLQLRARALELQFLLQLALRGEERTRVLLLLAATTKRRPRQETSPRALPRDDRVAFRHERRAIATHARVRLNLPRRHLATHRANPRASRGASERRLNARRRSTTRAKLPLAAGYRASRARLRDDGGALEAHGRHETPREHAARPFRDAHRGCSCGFVSSSLLPAPHHLLSRWSLVHLLVSNHVEGRHLAGAEEHLRLAELPRVELRVR